MTKLIRQVHRWICVVFTGGVTANIVVIFGLKHPQPPPLIGMLALIPLILLLATGLYMFVQPYVVRWRARRA